MSQRRHPVIDEDMDHIVGADLPWSTFAGKTVLVTGAAGMLPAYMVETLLRLNETRKGNGTHVLAVVRDLPRAKARFAAYDGCPDLELIAHDVSEPLDVRPDVRYVIHAASQASPKYYQVDPVGTLKANVLGTYNLLIQARQHRVEGFLFFSSAEVYGRSDSNRPAAENTMGSLDPTDVRSCYAESKRMGETLCACWHAQYGVPAKMVRPFHTYGPGMKLDDGRVFADFVADIVHGRDIVVKSDGSALRAFCYLADATIAFFAVLLRGKEGHSYNVGNDKAEISILDLAGTLARLYPEKGIKVVREEQTQDYPRGAVSRSCPDIGKIRELGWEPMTGIEEGFRRTIRSFQ